MPEELREPARVVTAQRGRLGESVSKGSNGCEPLAIEAAASIADGGRRRTPIDKVGAM